MIIDSLFNGVLFGFVHYLLSYYVFRSPNLADTVASSVGASIGTFIYHLAKRALGRRKQK